MWTRKLKKPMKYIRVAFDDEQTVGNEPTNPLRGQKCESETYRPRQESSKEMSHVDRSGAAQMVDISQKMETYREAGASARVCLTPKSFLKGDVLGVSRLAGIMGAKHTSLLLPLCHNIPLNCIDVDFALDEESLSIRITTKVSTTAPTGVEMEALTSASIAALNIIDMAKALDKEITITDLQLDYKRGGKSGTFIRKENNDH